VAPTDIHFIPFFELFSAQGAAADEDGRDTGRVGGGDGVLGPSPNPARIDALTAP
jgi:hypothetical protein